MNTREQIISRITSFPTLPIMAQKLIALLQDEEANTAEIEKIIHYDPALTANVLKAANSAFLGFREPVNSLAEASYRIGTKWVLQIAFSSLVYSNMKMTVQGYGLTSEDLWKHSIAVALMSENLSKLINIENNGIIFTAGLLHDIGKIVTDESVSESIEEIQQDIDDDMISFEEAEERILGLDHAEAGAMIAETWSFPMPIIQAIRWHHRPEQAETTLPIIDIVHVADAVCLMHGFGIGRDGLQYRCSQESIDRLGLTGAAIEKASSLLIDSFENIEKMFVSAPALNPVGR